LTGDESVVWYLRVSEEERGAVRILQVEGRISGATAAVLKQALDRVDPAGRRGVVVDLSGVDYVNSEGLRTLQAAAARLRSTGCELVACGVRPVVRTAFELAGVIEELAIEASRDAAMTRLGTFQGEPDPGLL
jgi:anti-anti-sigma factor